ncbi:MAG: TetR family transcriptional regulator [Nevskiales bacterium]
MSRTKATEENPAPAGGRQRLIEAALRIGAGKRSLQGLGLRELAREAGLNPNTFYRHFSSLEQLNQAIIDELGRDIRTNLRGIRRTVQSPVAEATPRTIEYVFDYALRNPDAFIVAVRELHGAIPALREALQRMIDDVAEETVEDVLFLNIVPGMKVETLREVSRVVVQHVFHQTLDYIEQPARRSQIMQQTVRIIDMLYAGALTMQAMKVDSLAELLTRQNAARK